MMCRLEEGDGGSGGSVAKFISEKQSGNFNQQYPEICYQFLTEYWSSLQIVLQLE